jgi:DNA-binding transcriptional regulator YiaG
MVAYITAITLLDKSSSVCYDKHMLDETKPTIGPYLKSLREAKGLSLREVEAKTGVSNAFLSQIESGKVKRPSPVMLYK